MNTTKITKNIDNAIFCAKEKARLNNFTFLKSDSNSVKVYLINTDEVVVFEKQEVAERIEYSEEWFMNGNVFQKGQWVTKYQSMASFAIGSDDFECLTDIELID